jgi:putative salt-induced outer membrane protein YdiY
MRRRRTIFTLAAALFAAGLAARPASAQVNTEALRRDVKTSPVFGSVDGNFTGRAGNVTGVIAGAGVFAGYHSGDHLAFVRAQGDYTEFDSVVKVAKAFAHARYNYALLGPFTAEVFTQAQRDRFIRLELRNLYGAGLRTALVEERSFEAFLGTAYMFEYEIEGRRLRDPEPAKVTAHRASIYLAPSWAISKSMRLSTVAYLQPRLDGPTDARFFDETVFTTDVLPRLKVRIGVSVRYDTEPPEGVKPWDVEVKNSLALVL